MENTTQKTKGLIESDRIGWPGTSETRVSGLMRGKSITLVICIVAVWLLQGCDFSTGYGIALKPDVPCESTEPNRVLHNDFNDVRQVVESWAFQEGFEECIFERGPSRRVYQKSDRGRLFRIYIIYDPGGYYIMHDSDNNIIEVSVLEMQVRKKTAVLEKMYIELRARLQEAFGDSRIK